MKKNLKKTVVNDDPVNLVDGLRQYAEKLKAFFGVDSGIAIDVDLENRKVDMIIPDKTKAESIAAIVNRKIVELDESPLHINGTPISEYKTVSEATMRMLNTAFSNNVHFSRIQVEGMFTFVMFHPEVISINNDSIFSPWGVVSVSSETLANELLNIPGSYFICTDISR